MCADLDFVPCSLIIFKCNGNSWSYISNSGFGAMVWFSTGHDITFYNLLYHIENIYILRWTIAYYLTPSLLLYIIRNPFHDSPESALSQISHFHLSFPYQKVKICTLTWVQSRTQMPIQNSRIAPYPRLTACIFHWP